MSALYRFLAIKRKQLSPCRSILLSFLAVFSKLLSRGDKTLSHFGSYKLTPVGIRSVELHVTRQNLDFLFSGKNVNLI